MTILPVLTLALALAGALPYGAHVTDMQAPALTGRRQSHQQRQTISAAWQATENPKPIQGVVAPRPGAYLSVGLDMPVQRVVRRFQFATTQQQAMFEDMTSPALCVCGAWGSGKTGGTMVGKITKTKLREIAEIKSRDLNINSIEAAERVVSGTARSMGVEIE